jgi:hypothetical protein
MPVAVAKSSEMDLYRLNCSALRAQGAEIASVLEGVECASQVQVLPTPAGVPTFSLTTSSGMPILFHSMYNPLKEAFQLTSQKDLSDVKMLFVLGLGFGYHIEHILKNPFFTGTIYVIEPSLEIFKALLTSRDVRSFLTDPRIRLFLQPDADMIKHVLYDADMFRTNVYKCEFLYLPAYKQVFADYYCKVLDTVNVKMSRGITNLFCIDELANTWEKNILANLPRIMTSVSIRSFIGRFGGVPALLVAAGPSLDENIHALKQYQGKALIFCVGTSFKPLLRAGIRPNFVVALDASDVTLAQYEGVGDLSGIWLLSEVTVSPKIIAKFWPRVAFYHSMGNPFLNTFYSKKATAELFMKCGGSVANSALDIAVKFGCDPLVFVAQDLCISQDGRSHASGTMHEDRRYDPNIKRIELLTVPGNYEQTVVQPRNFYIFNRWIENYMRVHKDRRFINATAGGARIEGAQLMALDEAFSSVSVAQGTGFEQLTAKLLARGTRRYPRHMLDTMRSLNRRFRSVDPLLRQGLRISRQMYRYYIGMQKYTEDGERRFVKRVVQYFKRLARVKALSLINYGVQSDTLLMFFSLETSRIKEQGYGEAIQRLPRIFKRFMKSSRLIQRTFSAILKERRR